MLDLLLTESPSRQQFRESISGFTHRVERFLHRLGVSEFECDEDKLVETHSLSMRILHHYINPSCFKAAAALTIGVGVARPFLADLPSDYGELANYPNAVFGILESVYCMHGAELLVAPDDVRVLEAPIVFSNHFFNEFVISCGKLGSSYNINTTLTGGSDRVNFRLLALGYEALAYQENKHCKYPPPTQLKLEKYFSILG